MPTDRLNLEKLRIHAFEPVPSTAKMFRERLAQKSGAICVTLHECAMSSEPGLADIAVYGDGAGTNTLHFDGDPRTEKSRIEVELKSLTTFCDEAGVDRINFAKCDTEGHDASVLKGAAPLFRSGRIDVIQFEYNHRWVFGRSYLKDVFGLVEGLPYTVARVDEERVTVFDSWHAELERFFQSNYVIIHDRALHWFPVWRGHFDETNTYA